MEIIVGKLSGFCGGVKRAVTTTEEKVKEKDRVYCYGEIVHNSQVINKLENMGMKTIEDINEVPNNEMVIFRAHGVEKRIYDIAKSKNLEVVDLSCPKVLKIHDMASKFVDDGYFIVLIAKNGHPETIGTISFCGDNSFIMENISEIDELSKRVEESGLKKIAILTQTTFSMDEYNMILESIKNRFKEYELNINNNICDATELRQKELKEIASQVDAMIIIGGKHSSNTKRLYEISLDICKNSYMIETVEELTEDFSVYSKVGVMAGASTPQEIIDDVVNYLKNVSK